MSNPSYPATLPTAPLIGFTEEPYSTAIKSEMDAGPAKQRQRYSTSWSRYKMNMILTAAQRATFKTFWQSTCKSGGQAFDWKDPATGDTATFVFVADRPPKFRSIGTDVFEVEFELETRQA